MSKPNPSNTSSNKVSKALKTHKLVVILLLLVMIFPLNFAFSSYKDWENGQMIKGLARDLPALVVEVETATGLNFDKKTDCSITQEKFSEGVKTCEVIYLTTADITAQEKIKDVVFESKKLNNPVEYNNRKGYDLKYKGKNSCGLGIGARGEGVVTLSCITAVREANIDLALTEFKLK